MLKPLRQEAGIGDSLYSINDNEAENHLLELKTEHKRVSLVTFISKSREPVKEQDALLTTPSTSQTPSTLSVSYKQSGITGIRGSILSNQFVKVRRLLQ